MRIEGQISTSGVYTVEAVLIYAGIQKPVLIEFIVDTGSTFTVIHDKDADRLGINYDDLLKAEEDVIGMGGDIPTYLLPKSKLIFTTNEGKEFSEDLDTGRVLRHRFKGEREKENIFILSSLLGMDILGKYTIHFSNFTVFLDL